jgi:hypothetical protein
MSSCKGIMHLLGQAVAYTLMTGRIATTVYRQLSKKEKYDIN